MLSVIMLSVIMLSFFMLNVEAPFSPNACGGWIQTMDNKLQQDETWVMFSTLEVAICIQHIYGVISQTA